MTYLLDSNIVIALLRPRQRAAVLPRLEAQPRGNVVTSAVVAHELYYGACHSADPDRNKRELAEMFADMDVLPLTRADAEAAGEVRAALRAVGLTIGTYGVLIAGQALARGLVLVTSNGREFGRVEGLVVEDWL